MIKIKKSDDFIAQRIKTAINKRGYINQQDFCIHCHGELSEPMLSDILNGQRRTLENMIMIAERLECSLDYIVGINDVMDLNTDIKALNKMTGLSETSINYLQSNKDSSLADAINHLLSTKEGNEIIYSIEQFLFFYPRSVKENVDTYFDMTSISKRKDVDQIFNLERINELRLFDVIEKLKLLRKNIYFDGKEEYNNGKK